MTRHDETLEDLIRAMWKARFYLLAGFFAGVVGAVIFVMLAVPYYRAEMVVVPKYGEHIQFQDNQMPVSSGIGDAQLNFQSYLKMISGPASVQNMMEKHPDFAKKIYVPRRFTMQQNARNSAQIEKLIPYFDRNIDIRRNGDTSLHIIRFNYPNPEIARQVLLYLHQSADGILRMKTLESAKGRIEYLQQSLGVTANIEHRNVLANLLEEQERVFMMAQMDSDYAAQIIEAPYVQEYRVWPRYEYILPVFILIGMTIGWIVFGITRRDE